MRTNYQRGYQLEVRCRKYYQNLGYYVMRSAGSKSPIDLLAIKDGEIIAIQCKAGESPFKQADKDELVLLCNYIKATPVLCRTDKNSHLLFELL